MLILYVLYPLIECYLLEGEGPLAALSADTSKIPRTVPDT